MNRRLFTAGSLLSLVVLAGTVLLIAQSWFGDRGFILIQGASARTAFDQRKLQVRARRGILYLSGDRVLDDTVTTAEIRASLGFRRLPLVQGDELDVLLSRTLGFAYASGSFDLQGNEIHVGWWRISVPLWLIALMSAALPASRTCKFRRKAVQASICSRCNYDLRASKNRCPECGTPIPTKPEPQ